MNPRFILFLIIGIDTLNLIYQISNLSISAGEATLLYGESSFLQILTNFSLKIFGQNDYALRFVMLLFHIMSIILLYEVSKIYIKSDKDRVWLILIFIMLPGVVSAAVVVNSAGFIIFALLFFIYLRQKAPQSIVNILLLVYALVDRGFLYLFLGLLIEAIFQKRRALFYYSICLIFLNIYMFGIDIGGFPQGHFLDAIGVYSAIFTPIIFIYLLYNLYRRYLTNQLDLIWYIATTTLLYSLILSLRQQVALEYYAPYLILSLPLAAQTFINAYRVRLKQFRKGYKIAFVLSFMLLSLNLIVVLFNQELYIFLDNPKHNFAYKMHIAKDLAYKLKKQGISCVQTQNDMQQRLRFYGITSCDQVLLSPTTKNPDVTISYRNKILYSASVTKLNNK